jgi:hypothetical protein
MGENGRQMVKNGFKNGERWGFS